MTQQIEALDILDKLSEDPTLIFSSLPNTSTANEDDKLQQQLLHSVKSILDPIASSNSVLDEIYVDGLMPSQVWGQVKLIVDGCVENVLFDKIGSLKEKYGDALGGPSSINEDEDEEDEEEDEEYEDEEDEEEEEGELDVNMEEKELVKTPEQGSEEFSDAEYYNAVEDQEEEENDDAFTTAMQDDSQQEIDNDDIDYIPQKDKFGLNDQFFSIDDYNKHVLAMEEAEAGLDGDDDEEVDLFADMNDDEEDEMYTYGDFFKKQVDQTQSRKQQQEKPKNKSVKFAKSDEEFQEEDYDDAFKDVMADLMGDQEEETKDDKNLSTFEKQQKQLQEEINALEAESIAEKKWTMKGEASVKSRGTDTLLDEELEFDRTAKPVPVITQEVTESIEEIIKRRIKDQQFDELPRRIISELNDFKPSQRVEVSENKSTKSLAQLYEDDYLQKETDAVSEELASAHNEISELFGKLMGKLDSLTSSHFIPKPKQQLVDIKVQTSTIQLEDQQPLTMSTSDTLAPQEVYSSKQKLGKNEISLKNGVVINKEELDRSEKQRIRRARKRKIHNKMKENAEKKQKVVVKQY